MAKVFYKQNGKNRRIKPKSVGLGPSKLCGIKVSSWKSIKLHRRHPIPTRNILTENRSKKRYVWLQEPENPEFCTMVCVQEVTSTQGFWALGAKRTFFFDRFSVSMFLVGIGCL